VINNKTFKENGQIVDNAENEYSRSHILQQSSKTVSLEKAQKNKHLVVDVRSGKEFSEGTIPGAINIPLFEDDERGIIGTLYRHVGQDEAVDKGFEFVEKRLEALVESFVAYKAHTLTIFCAKGGMRSRSVVNLLERFGYDGYQLEGGFKKYRRDVLQCLERFSPDLIVIHGLTGTGKTRILQELDDQIDLEDLAQHRSSLFGAIDRSPRNQRDFESLLVKTIDSLGEEPYFIEGESRKIGRVFTPKPLAMAMKKGVLVKVDCCIETRIERIIADYPVKEEETIVQLEKILNSLRQKMGHQEIDKLCGLLRGGNLEELVRILLVDYYDKRYNNSMKGYRYDLELSSEDIPAVAAQLSEFRDSLRKK